MRKEYGQALYAEFSRLLGEKAPEFEPVSLRSVYVFPGSRLFRWVPVEPYHCYLVLVPHKNGDDFVVELGWSSFGRFPERSVGPSFGRPNQDDVITESEYVCRIGSLYCNRDKWWSIWAPSQPHPDDPLASLLESVRPIPADEAEAAVRRPVAEAVERVVKHGIPYLREWAGTVACARPA